jgi:cytochrome c556
MRTVLSTLVFSLALLLLTGNINAHMGAKGVVKERMEAMKSIGKAMKSMSRMARGKAPLDFATIELGARTILHHGRAIPSLFPKGSRSGVSEASPMIWQDPDSFANSAGKMVSAAHVLQTAATEKKPAAVKSAFRALGKTCSGCHKQFRIKRKNN